MELPTEEEKIYRNLFNLLKIKKLIIVFSARQYRSTEKVYGSLLGHLKLYIHILRREEVYFSIMLA